MSIKLTPIPVELVPHDPAWADRARREHTRLMDAIGDYLVEIQHIGSTSIPGIRAKPTIDLVPVVRDLETFEQARPMVESLGYQWVGEFGLPGRRYCRLIDPITNQRLFHLHCYQLGSSEIERHVAFRDYLLAHPAIAAEYDREKGRCRDLHPSDSHAYTDCKSAWIKRVEQEAIAFVRSRDDVTASVDS